MSTRMGGFREKLPTDPGKKNETKQNKTEQRLLVGSQVPGENRLVAAG